MCVANCFAPHTSCSLRKITRLCDAQQCASSHVTFGILNMLVVVRNAPYLYLRIEGDPWIELYRLRYHIYFFQIIARYEVHNQLHNSLSTYLHFRCSIQNIILKLTDTATGNKPYKDNIGQHQSRDKRHNSFMYSIVGADSDLPDTIAIGNHHVPKLYGLPLLMPLWNKDY